MLDLGVGFSISVIAMRELTLLESGYLAGLLLLSVVLPLLMSIRGPRDAATKRSCLKTVWIGQTPLTVAGLAVLVSAPVAPYAVLLGVTSWICCTLVLLHQFRTIRPA